MTLKFLGIPAALLAMTALGTAPAFAQREHRGEQGRTPQAESRGRTENRGGGQRAQPRAEAPAPRQQAPAPSARQQQPAPAPRAEAQPRYDARYGYDAPRRDAPRGQVTAPRTAPYAVPRATPRENYNYGYRGGYNNGYRGGYNNGYRGGYYAGPRWGGYSGHWDGWRGYSAFRPYFFRPWYRIGFSINVGYPVAYYAYPYPVPVYGYGAPYSEVYVGPNASYGGVALQIQPDDAFVYVDGGYAGIARDFDGTRQPLTLTPGTHHIEITQNGFEPLAFDVTIQPGTVIPYEGGLRPY